MKRVIGLGAGGHAKVVIEILRQNKRYEIAGLLNANEELRGTDVLGIPVLGDDQQLSALFEQGIRHAFIGVGSVGGTSIRRRLFELARSHGYEMVAAIHQHSVISPSVKVGHGPTVMPGAIINTSATLGDNVIINTGAIVEHDCIIGNHASVASGAVLASTVRVGAGSHIGAGSTVRQSINIGENSIIGAGAVVIKDVPDNVIVVGVPATVLRAREQDLLDGVNSEAPRNP